MINITVFKIIKISKYVFSSQLFIFCAHFRSIDKISIKILVGPDLPRGSKGMTYPMIVRTVSPLKNF